MSVHSVSLNPGEHACHFFRGFAEQKSVVLPFFQEGLKNGEHCLYITSEQAVDEWCIELQAFGVDVQHEIDRGALLILEKEAWRQPGDFKSIVKAREALSLIDGRLADFSGVRIAGDAAWALNPELPIDQLCQWEATANLVYEGQAVRAICQYSLTEHSAPALHTALRTHPIAIMEGRTITNRYYEAPLILEQEPHLYDSNADTELVERMVAELRSGS